MCISSEKYGKYVPRSSPAIWWPNLRSVVVGERHGISPEQSGLRDSYNKLMARYEKEIQQLGREREEMFS